MKCSLNLSLRQSCCYCVDHVQRTSLLFQNMKYKIAPLHSLFRQHHPLSLSNQTSNASFPWTFQRMYSTTTTGHRTQLQLCRNFYKRNSTLLQSYFKSRIDNNRLISRSTVTTSYLSNNKRNIVKTAKSQIDIDNNNNNVVLDRYIYVKTLDSLYEDVTNGIILDTAYGDSRPDDNFDPSVPVVVALHDTPGTHKDVVPLLSFFAKIGCRTLCPTFPGHGDTRGIMRNYDDIFAQATMERAAFIHDFLGDIGIKKVDVLIGVGASSYTAMALCTKQAEVYRSMALISPWPLSQTRFDINNKMLDRIHDFWELVYFRPAARLLLPAFRIGNTVTTDEKIAACYLLKNLDFGEAEGFALTASLRDVPRLVAYGAKDELVKEELYDDLISKIGINSHHVISDHQKGMAKDNANQPTALRFADSGYDILTHHRTVLCAHILRMVQQFHPNIKI